MNGPDVTPPLFEMDLPYPQMGGKNIRVVRGTATAIGTLVTYHRPQERTCGIRIDILHPPVYHPRAEPVPLDHWVDVGVIPVTSLKLSKEQIARIKQVDKDDHTFELELE